MPDEANSDLRISTFLPFNKETSQPVQQSQPQPFARTSTPTSSKQIASQQHKPLQQLQPKASKNQNNNNLKSCLVNSEDRSATGGAKTNQKKKTVAFGSTVNVSQTIEGTSRLTRQKSFGGAAEKKTSPIDKTGTVTMAASANEGKENRTPAPTLVSGTTTNKTEQMLEQLLNEVTGMKEEMRQKDEKWSRQYEGLCDRVNALTKQAEDPERSVGGHSPREEITSSAAGQAEQIGHDDDVFNTETITVLKARYAEDPVLRQFIDDALNDHKYNQANRSRNFDSPRPAFAPRTSRTPQMTECRVAAKSVRQVAGGVEYSIDTRRFVAKITDSEKRNREMMNYENSRDERRPPPLVLSTPVRALPAPALAARSVPPPVSLYQPCSNELFDEETPLDENFSHMDVTSSFSAARRQSLNDFDDGNLRNEIRDKFKIH